MERGITGAGIIGASTSLVLNVLSSTLDEQVDFVLDAFEVSAASSGSISLVEIGNEIYGTTPRMLSKFPDGTSYGMYAESAAMAIMAALCNSTNVVRAKPR